MKKLSHAEISQGRVKPEQLPEVKRMPFVALLSSIRSAYNVGSIFRTSDAAMIEKLYLCGYTPAPPRQEVMKTALGATESVPWEYNADTLSTLRSLKQQGYKIAALELTDNGRNYTDVNTEDFPVCLILGNEISGVDDEFLAECDFAVEIPQYGIKQSMNVAVAYGVAVFEFRKKYDAMLRGAQSSESVIPQK